MAYSRSGAVKFAEAHWNTPADDGLFWLSNQAVMIDQVRNRNVIPTSNWKKAPIADGWQPFFMFDGVGGEMAVFTRPGTTEKIPIHDWNGLADCAHFLSRCLTAGGLNVAEIAVPNLVRTLKSRANAKVLCEQVSTDAGQRVIDTGIFKPGDMVGYFNVSPTGDYGGLKQYSHSAMYVGKIAGKTDGGITCHTVCRFPGHSWTEDSWWLDAPGHYLYTLIHFSDDDLPPDPVKAAALAGWWQLDYSGRTEYYFMSPTGKVTYTKRAPIRGQTIVHVPEGTAFWFMATNGEITFTWRDTGTVEVWRPNRARGYASTINGLTPGVLTKLF